MSYNILSTEILIFPWLSCEHDPYSAQKDTSTINNISRFVEWISYITSIDIIKVLTDVSIIFDVLPQMKLIGNYDGCGDLHNCFQLCYHIL